MGGHIGNDLAWSLYTVISTPGSYTVQDFILHALCPVDKARCFRLKHMPLNGVSCIIAEHTYIFVKKLYITFQSRSCAVLHGCHISRPWFAVDQDFSLSVNSIEFSSDAVHKLHVKKSHKVETESVNMIFPYPVNHRIQNISGTHRTLACHIVSTGRAIGNLSVFVCAEIIPGHCTIQVIIQ